MTRETINTCVYSLFFPPEGLVGFLQRRGGQLSEEAMDDSMLSKTVSDVDVAWVFGGDLKRSVDIAAIFI